VRRVVVSPDAKVTVDVDGGAGASGGSFGGDTVVVGGSGGVIADSGSVLADSGGVVGGGGQTDGAVDRPPPDAPPRQMPGRSPPDTAPPTSPPDRMPAVADAAPEPPAPKVVQLVVGDPAALVAGDLTIRTILASTLVGYGIRLRDDNGPVDLVNTSLIVISGSVESLILGNRYRDVPVPVLSLEYSQFDDLGMTGPTQDTDFGLVGGDSIDFIDSVHPLAAGLTGTVAVTTQVSDIGWGNPGRNAVRIATVPGRPNQVAIFGYPTNAQMVAGVAAPAKRIGFFAIETSASLLSNDGVRLVTAAINWAVLPD
jgi:hypothetical protein